jgi:hypothetical protein
LIISMNDSKAASLEQIRAFLAGSAEMQFAARGREEVYGWIERTLVQHEYAGLDKSRKGLVRRYLAHMTGLSRAQLTGLIAQQVRTGAVKAAAYRRRRSPHDILLPTSACWPT